MVELNNVTSRYHFMSLLHPVSVFYPLTPEFKIPPNLLMPEMKWQYPGNIQRRCTLHFLVLSYS